MNRALAIGGGLIVIISIIGLFRIIEKKEIQLNGKEIEVRIVDIPVSCKESSKWLKPYFKFEYNNKKYSKNIKGKYCKILENSRIIILKTNSDNSIFIFPDENINRELIWGIILLVIGGLCCFKGLKKTIFVKTLKK